MFPYKGALDDDVFASFPSSHATTQPVAPSPPLQIECILDKRVSKKTRRATYYEYLVKWMGQPKEYATWLTKVIIAKIGFPFSNILHNGT